LVIQLIQSVDRIQASHLGLFSAASLRSVVSGLTDKGRWSLHILERPAFSFLPLSATPGFLPLSDKGSPERKGNIPTLEEWRVLWSAWDLVTLHMIPRVMLHEKPIDLRHKCLFYIGHIPTLVDFLFLFLLIPGSCRFLDMLLSKAIGGGPSEPSHFWDIFEVCPNRITRRRSMLFTLFIIREVLTLMSMIQTTVTYVLCRASYYPLFNHVIETL